MSKEDFRTFIAKNPTFASYVNDGSMTWQKFYEMYDMYGENSSVWSKYQRVDKETVNVSKINDLIKNVDMNSIKEHIGVAQKALDFVQELTSKTPNVGSKIPTAPRPLNKFFED